MLTGCFAYTVVLGLLTPLKGRGGIKFSYFTSVVVLRVFTF